MISKPKKLLYGAALVISSGLFANEVVNATQREQPPEPLERPAEAELGESGSPQASLPPAVPHVATPADDMTAIERHEAAAQADPLAALEAALSKLGAADAAGEGEDLADSPRQRRKRPQPSETTSVEPEPAPAPAPRVSAAARAERRERIDKLFEEQPLVGVVSGPEGTLALVGGRSVRVGDLLGDGETRVLECTSTGIRVEFEGEPAWIALPGLRVHEKVSKRNEGGAGVPVPPLARNAPQNGGNDATAATSGGVPSSQGGQP